MQVWRAGRYRARLIWGNGEHGAADAAHRLRAAAFAVEGDVGSRDVDAHDRHSWHLVVEARGDDEPLACLRLRVHPERAGPMPGYVAAFYDLTRFAALPGRKLELGRICTRPGCCDGDAMRALWVSLGAVLAGQDADWLFGCVSFPGTDPAPFRPAFELLAAAHLAPAEWRPAALSAEGVPLVAPQPCDRQAGLRAMPPLLRSYLDRGARVSDHAAVDRDLGTIHVFAALGADRLTGAGRGDSQRPWRRPPFCNSPAYR